MDQLRSVTVLTSCVALFLLHSGLAFSSSPSLPLLKAILKRLVVGMTLMVKSFSITINILGNICGYGDTKDYKYLYFPVPKSGYYGTTLCLKSCPKTVAVNDLLECYPNTWTADCKVTHTDPSTLSGTIAQGTIYGYETTSCNPFRLNIIFSYVKILSSKY